MKIQIISDLHLEFGMSQWTFDNAELVIFAGDINLGTKGIEWVKSKIKDKPIIYVLGNHEYYKGHYPNTLNKIKLMAQDSNIFVLEDDFVDIENIRFHGCTLWTDFSIFSNPVYHSALCQTQMNDYRLIRKNASYSKINPVDILQIHQKSKSWLENSLESTTKPQNVVVTHHAPSLKSVPEIYKNDPLTAAYANNMDDFILKYQPNIWIHGHIHTPKRYHIGKTEVICNPFGYINEPFNNHIKELLVDI